MNPVAGFPYWEVEFSADGKIAAQKDVSKCIKEVIGENIADLFIFSHGWNNDHTIAREIYLKFFETVRHVLLERGTAIAENRIGIIGVLWPSILFPDDQPTASRDAAGFEDADVASNPIVELRKIFPEQTQTLEELGRLLDEQPESVDALKRFQVLLATLAPPSSTDEGSNEDGLLKSAPEKVFERLSVLAPLGERPDAAAFDDGFRRLWAGAKEALRVTSYWNMKERAGYVGERGLGPFIGELKRSHSGAPGLPELRIHLIGHSFGARVVSFSLKGLPASFTGTASPVKSLTLIQGAFSHFAFAKRLPHDEKRAGGLAGMQARVDGPIVVTHSRHDLAVGQRYPQASIVARDDAAGIADALSYRFGGMGFDGAQAVDASAESFKAVGQPYELVKGHFLNLNGDGLITKGKPPSGAHSDIFYDEIAWVVLLASNVASPTA